MRSRGLAIAPVGVVALFLLVPVIAVLIAGIRPESLHVVMESRTWRIVGFTALQALLSTVASVALALPATYALHRLRLRLRRLTLAVLTVPFVLPTVVVGLAFRTLLPDSLNGTLTAIILAHAFFNIGLVVRVVGGVWSRLDGRMQDVARTLGMSPFTVFCRVTLPYLRPAILASTALVAMFTFTSFGVIMVLGSPAQPTIEVEIYRRTTQILDIPAAAGLALVQLIIVVVALIWSAVLQRRTVMRMRQSSAPLQPVSNKCDRLCIVWTYVLALVLTLPVLALILRSLRAGNQWSLQWYQQIAAPSGGTTRDIGAFSIVTTSLRYAVLATLLAVVLGVLGAMAVQLATRRGVTLETTLLLPLGVSAVTIGFGLLLMSIHGPVDLRGWTLLVPLGQSLVAAPLVMMLLLPILRSIDPRLRYVATTLGAGPLKAWWAVDGRLIGRATVGAAGLACAVSLGEFGATAFLARVDEPTIPLQIVRLLGRPGEANFGSATAFAVVLLAITAVVLTVTDRGRTQW